MDYIIGGSLLIIALCMVFGRPLRLELQIQHKLEQPPPTPKEQQETKEQEEQQQMMDNVAKVIQDIMYGGDLNGSQSTERKV